MTFLKKLLTTTAFASTIILPFAGLTPAAAHEDHDKHVLLISIDGFHAADLEICVANKTCPNLAALSKTGVTYTNASTTKPSDSFPGMVAQVSGATPKSAGVFYDDSYDRTLYAPNAPPAPAPKRPMRKTPTPT